MISIICTIDIDDHNHDVINYAHFWLPADVSSAIGTSGYIHTVEFEFLRPIRRSADYILEPIKINYKVTSISPSDPTCSNCSIFTEAVLRLNRGSRQLWLHANDQSSDAINKGLRISIRLLLEVTITNYYR